METATFIEDDGRAWYEVEGERFAYTREGQLLDEGGCELPEGPHKADVERTIMFSTRSLCRLDDGEYLRPAVASECTASDEAAENDGGVGAIKVEGVACYVEEG
jgi:hypothetical protein